MKLSICIVNFRTKNITLKSMEHIFRFYEESNFEIILIDNTPGGEFTEEDVKGFSNVKLIPNFSNKYFSGGYNKAASYATGEFLLLMTPDIILIDDSISKLLHFIEGQPKVGAVSGTFIEEPTGKIIRTGSKQLTKFRDLVRSKKILKFLFRSVYNDYCYLSWDRKSSKEVEVITNAFIMIRRALFVKIGGLEEAMKLYFTEERMCDQIRAEGYSLWQIAEAKVSHYISESVSTRPSKWIRIIYKTDRKLYFGLGHTSIRKR